MRHLSYLFFPQRPLLVQIEWCRLMWLWWLGFCWIIYNSEHYTSLDFWNMDGLHLPHNTNDLYSALSLNSWSWLLTLWLLYIHNFLSKADKALLRMNHHPQRQTVDGDSLKKRLIWSFNQITHHHPETSQMFWTERTMYLLHRYVKLNFLYLTAIKSSWAIWMTTAVCWFRCKISIKSPIALKTSFKTTKIEPEAAWTIQS